MRNTIPDNGHATHAGTDLNDLKLFHQIIVNGAQMRTLELYGQKLHLALPLVKRIQNTFTATIYRVSQKKVYSSFLGKR